MAEILKFLDKPEFKKIKKEVEDFTGQILDEYLSRLDNINKHNLIANFFSEKDIYDAVWGTIKINLLETIIIDSPLIQRLRHIKHLGLAGLLFPGADYSRFEHTIGTMHIAAQFAERIQATCKGNAPAVNPIQLCRLAAVFHDAGHLFFSHCSEKFYESIFFSRCDEVRHIIKEFKDFKGANTGFAEILSVLIIASPAVNALIFKAWELSGEKSLNKGSKTNLINTIIAHVLGLPTCTAYLPYYSIISGTIDADKCDYLARDSHKTGVPVAVDLMRLIQKLKVLELKSPLIDIGKAWEEPVNSHNRYYCMGVEPSAVNSIEEIIISRSLLFEKIYYHHKIRTAEEMVRQAIRLIDESGLELFSNLTYCLNLTDSDLVSAHPEIFLKALCKKYRINRQYDFTNAKFKTACTLLKSVHYRQLFKRACVIIYNENREIFSATQSIEMPGTGSTIKELFDEIFEVKENYFNFIEKIRTEVQEIFQLLKKEYYSGLDSQILIVSRKVIQNPDLNIWINYGTKKIKYNAIFQGESWLHSRLTNYPYYYIVGPAEIRQELYLAVQKILFKNYNFILRESSYIFAKIEETELENLRKALYDKNYYSDAVQLLPDDRILFPNTMLTTEKLEELYRNFSQYSGPGDAVIKSGEPILYFIKQFIPFLDNKTPEEKKSFIKGVCRVLEKTRVIGRNVFVESLLNNFQKITLQSGHRINDLNYFILGGTRDSSNHIVYYFTEINSYLYTKSGMNSRKQNLPDPEIITRINGRENYAAPVVFFDDTCYSGKQVVNIFQEMTGLPLEKRCCRGEHGVHLNAGQLAVLKAAKIFLVFCYMQEGAEKTIQEELNKLGFTDVTIYRENPFPRPLFDEKGFFDTENQHALCKEIFSEVGRRLLETEKKPGSCFLPGWDDERIMHSALGYNNAQQLIVLPWNTPTYTLTCFWKKATVTINGNTFEWRPLFPRLGK